MKKIILYLSLLIASIAVNAQIKIQNPATFDKISFDRDGFGTATGTGYITKVPSQAVIGGPFCAYVPEVSIFMLSPDNSGHMIYAEIKKSGKLWAPSNPNDLYTGSVDGKNYSSPRRVTVQIQAHQLMVNGKPMFMADGTPAVASEEVIVFL